MAKMGKSDVAKYCLQMLCQSHFAQVHIQLRKPTEDEICAVQSKEIIKAKEGKCNVLKCISIFHSSKILLHLNLFLAKSPVVPCWI